jgi:putative transposase
MPLTRHLISTFAHFIVLVRHLVADFAGLATSWYRSRGAPTAENLFLLAIHDRDRIYSKDLDQAVEAMSVRGLRTPVRAPKGNSYCERIVRTARRECLDFMMPLGERHLRRILLEWVAPSNQARPHQSLGPGIPAPIIPLPPPSDNRDCLPSRHFVRVKPVLGGLHHEY